MTANLREGETRDDTHASRNAAQLAMAEDGDPCPDCEKHLVVEEEPPGILHECDDCSTRMVELVEERGGRDD